MMLSAGKVRMIPCYSEADSFLVVSLILDIYVVLERSACKKIFVRFSSFLLLNSANLSRNPRPRKKDWELANFRVARNKGQSRHSLLASASKIVHKRGGNCIAWTSQTIRGKQSMTKVS